MDFEYYYDMATRLLNRVEGQLGDAEFGNPVLNGYWLGQAYAYMDTLVNTKGVLTDEERDKADRLLSRASSLFVYFSDPNKYEYSCKKLY